MVVIAQAARLVVEQHGPQAGRLVGDGEKLVDLLLVLHRRMRHLRVSQHIRHLLGDAVGIDRDRDGAEPLAAAMVQ